MVEERAAVCRPWDESRACMRVQWVGYPRVARGVHTQHTSNPEMASPILPLLLLCACLANALVVSGRAGVPAAALRPRAPAPAMQFDLGALFGGKKQVDKPSKKNVDAILAKPQEKWTPEERRLVSDTASNWGYTRKPEQEGYTFFQGPSPKTGEQEDLPGFFSSENFVALLSLNPR